MFDEPKKLNIDTCSDAELKVLIRQSLPIVETFVKASQRLLSEDETNVLPCDNCDKYRTCTETCEAAEKELPGVMAGSYLLNQTYGNLMDKLSVAENTTQDRNAILKTSEIPARDALFNLYRNCQHIFTDKQWAVVCMKYEQGLQNIEIAKQTGQTQSSVCDMLKRADKRMKNQYEKKNT